MLSSSNDHRLRFERLYWYGLIGLCALLTGYYLAESSILVAMAFMGALGVITLPYHSKLSIYLAVATFSSALIMPLFPGRPYIWEFAALLGWSGVCVAVFMRQHAPDSGQTFRQHRWLFLGVMGYCVVLVVTVVYRGFGLRILGSEQMGGRYYFQQLSCAIFPFLFVLCRPREKVIVRLLIWQNLLTATFLISDFVLARAPGAMLLILQFFELSGDAWNFEVQAMQFGVRRFQSFYLLSTGLFFLLLIKNNLSEFFGRKGPILFPLALATLAVGMFSGHRFLAVVVFGVLTLSAYAERVLTLKNTFIIVAASAFVLVMAYSLADRLPLAVQRVVSFLPGISIDSQARIDAENTIQIRRVLREIGMRMIPDYIWLGRGFQVASVDYSWQWDPTTVTSHVNVGRFFNGFVGLMVNTGVFGTTFMLMFLGAGSRLAWQILRFLRQHGCPDDLSRVSKLVASVWISNVFAFLFLHGDSEYALKTFSLQAGLMLACRVYQEKRLLTVE